LPKWKIFSRLKEEKYTSTGFEARTEQVGESEERSKTSELREESEEMSVKVYNETLYSEGFIQKKPTTRSIERKQPSKRLSWENLVTIEHNIDAIECKKTEVRGTRMQVSDDIDQEIDRIFSQTKIMQ